MPQSIRITFCTLVILALPLSARAQPQRPASPSRTPLATTLVRDSGDTLSQILKARRPLRKGTIGSLGSRRVELSNGATLKLSDIATSVFREQSTFATQAKTASRSQSGGLFGRSSTREEVYEFPNSYVLVRSNAVVVANPRSFSQRSSLFGDFRASQSGTVKLSDLGSEGKRGMAAFKRNELPSLPTNHPLKLAAVRGDQALLAAIVSGQGDFEVIDTIQIPKKAPKIVNGKLVAPSIVNGRVDYGRTRNLQLSAATQRVDTQITAGASADIQRRLDSLRPRTTRGGMSRADVDFLAGFTVSDSWIFERTFRFTSGFFRIKAGAHYAFGLRIPIRAHTNLTPARICTSQGTNSEVTAKDYKISLSVETFDADADFYRGVGLRESAIASGHELAFEAGAGYGYKLRLAWTTVADRKYQEHGVDEGLDFTPPLSSSYQSIGAMFINPELTRTAFRQGPLSGSVSFGFKLEAKADIKMVFSPYRQIDGRARGDASLDRVPAGVSKVGSGPQNRGPFRVKFQNTNKKDFQFSLGKIANQKHAETKYGFRIDAPEYHSEWAISPGVRIKASARKWGYGFSFIREIWFPQARVPIGSLTLRRHKGTRSRFDDNSGHKIFHMNEGGEDFCGARSRARATRRR